MKTLLHIGAGKCGSSALQRFLSMNPVLPLRNGGHLVYAVILHNGDVMTGKQVHRSADGTGMQMERRPITPGLLLHKGRRLISAAVRRNRPVLSGPQVRRRARRTISGYVSSAPLSHISQNLSNFRVPGVGKNDVVVLSCEGWRKEFDRLKTQDALAAFGQVDALMYVRPQTEYINSAYWQWGAWSDRPFDDWFAGALDDGKWARAAQAWNACDRVNDFAVRVVPDDVVTDFLEFVGAEPSVFENLDGKRLNSGLSDTILRVMQRHRELRPSSHESYIDFVLEKHFGHLPGKPAWVLSPEHIEAIITRTRSDNETLQTLMSEDQAQAMQADRKWWEVVAPDRKLADPGVLPPADPAADAIMAIAFAELLNFERNRARRFARLIA